MKMTQGNPCSGSTARRAGEPGPEMEEAGWHQSEKAIRKPDEKKSRNGETQANKAGAALGRSRSFDINVHHTREIWKCRYITIKSKNLLSYNIDDLGLFFKR